MKAVDSHAHLDFPQFDPDRAELIEKLNSRDLTVINVATDEQSITKVVDLANSNKHLFAAVGIHPTDLNRDSLEKLPGLIDRLKELIEKESKVVAIGEIGLDYFHDSSKETAEIQIVALKQFLTLVQEVKRPVIFHCRDAYGDLLTLLQDYANLTGVVHCFSGNLKQAEQFVSTGLLVSFTAMITYPKNEELRAVVKEIPLDKILLETDCPFLPPQTRRSERNDPITVFEIAQKIALIKNISEAEVLAQTTSNARKLFGLTTEN